MISRPQPTKRGILEKNLFPFLPFQQTMVLLIPYRTRTRIPELVVVLNDSVGDRWLIR